MTATTWTFGDGGKFRLAAAARARSTLVAPVADSREVFPVAAALAVAAAGAGHPVLVAEPHEGRRRRPGAFSTSLSRGVADLVRARFGELEPVTRGPICHLSLPDDEATAEDYLAELPGLLPETAFCLVPTRPAGLRRLIESDRFEVNSAVLVADLPVDRALTALACADLNGRDVRCRVWKSPLVGLRAQLAVAGLSPGGETAETAARILAGLKGAGDDVAE